MAGLEIFFEGVFYFRAVEEVDEGHEDVLNAQVDEELLEHVFDGVQVDQREG